MKTLVHILLIFMLSCGFAYAGGDKNHGTKGKGTVSTGSQAQGKSLQQRSGR